MRLCRTRKIAAGLSTILLFGCASAETVRLRGSDNQVAQCGPDYRHYGAFMETGHETREELLGDCIADYERRGYQPIP